MIRTTAIDIAAPIDEVFAYVANPVRWPTGATLPYREQIIPGPVGVGTIFVAHAIREELSERREVIEFDVPTRILYQVDLVGKPLGYEGYTLASRESGTHLVHEARVEGWGWTVVLMKPLIALVERRSMRAMKKLLEAHPN